MANFIVMMILFLVFFIFMEIKIYSLIAVGFQTTTIGVVFGALIVLFISVLIKLSGLTYTSCGITLRNWKKSLIESFLWTIPALIVLTVLKWILLINQVTFVTLGGTLFSPYVSLASFPVNQHFSEWVTSLFLYCFLSVPMQELVTRGALQTALEKFQDNKHKVWISILV